MYATAKCMTFLYFLHFYKSIVEKFLSDISCNGKLETRCKVIFNNAKFLLKIIPCKHKLRT